MNKIRFGVVGTNFITDWVIAGAREDVRFELAAISPTYSPHWKRWQQATRWMLST